MKPLGVYWWAERTNFGDILSPILIHHFVQTNVQWVRPEDADMVSTGSVLDILPQKGWSGVVAGSGKLLEITETDLTDAYVAGLRGHLTLEAVKLNPYDRRHVVIGDPGLLASDIVRVQERDKYPLGLVPHWSDMDLWQREIERSRREHYVEPLLINPTQNPVDVITAIASCSKIISSSLHGIIVADAFGIPRRAERFPAMFSNRHEGFDFKWRDYGSSIGQPVEFGVLQEAPRLRVEQIQYELFDMFTSLAGRVSDLV